MPVLGLEPFVFPEGLLASASPPECAGRWWVLHTRPRAEKSLARTLLKRQIPYFLPLYQHRWRSRSRLLTSFLPLFPGYLFIRGDNHARIQALTTNQVARCLEVEDQQKLAIDLSRVHQLMISGAPLAPEERMQPGTWVEITSGPLAGMEGKILRRGNQMRFFVEVHFLQRGASVEMDGWMMKPLTSPPPCANGD